MSNLNEIFLVTIKYFTKNVVRSPIGALPKVSRWKVNISNDPPLEAPLEAKFVHRCDIAINTIVRYYMITYYLCILYLRLSTYPPLGERSNLPAFTLPPYTKIFDFQTENLPSRQMSTKNIFFNNSVSMNVENYIKYVYLIRPTKK